MADWNKIKAEYIAGGTSYRKLAEKYGVSRSKLQAKATNENWVNLKSQTQAKVESKIVDSISDKESEKAINKLSRVADLTDKLLDKLEQAINELDIQLYKDVERTKEIEYNNELRPDKPTKEIIHETEKVIEVKTIVDRSGLKAIASSLRDIKEIQMIKSDLDRREQEARIKALESRGGLRDTEDEETGVVALPAVMEVPDG